MDKPYALYQAFCDGTASCARLGKVLQDYRHRGLGAYGSEATATSKPELAMYAIDTPVTTVPVIVAYTTGPCTS